MKYDKETTDKIIAAYTASPTPGTVEALAAELDVRPRSVTAKLASLGIYQKKRYVTKRGELPIKKEEYIAKIADLLDVDQEILESLEKANKSVLRLLEAALDAHKDEEE